MKTFNIAEIRNDFPIFSRKIHGKPLVYFDNAATTLKPRAVAQVVSDYLLMETANVHRGIHTLSDQATSRFEAVREKTRAFLGAELIEEIVFTKGTTEGINLIANGYGRKFLNPGDEILVSELEHHSNIVPWQMAAENSKARVIMFRCQDDGSWDLEDFKQKLNSKTKIVAVAAISNTLGSRNPVEKIIELAHGKGAHVLIDAAQWVSHEPIHVQNLNCDYLVFSGHKLFAPTGVGVLYGKKDLLEKIPPMLGGGAMIQSVTFEKTTYTDLPFRLESGTPAIAEILGLGAALDYFGQFAWEDLHRHEEQLTQLFLRHLSELKNVRLYGPREKRFSIFSFSVEGIHPHDLGMLLDQEGVAVRTGHHCTQPLMKKWDVTAMVRASLSFYNTTEEVERFFAALKKGIEVLQ